MLAPRVSARCSENSGNPSDKFAIIFAFSLPTLQEYYRWGLVASSSSCAWHKRLPKRARCPRSLAQRGRLPDGLKSGWIFRAKRRGGQSPFLNQHRVAGLITAGDATMFWADGAAILKFLGGIVLSQVALLTALLAWTAIKSIARRVILFARPVYCLHRSSNRSTRPENRRARSPAAHGTGN